MKSQVPELDFVDVLDHGLAFEEESFYASYIWYAGSLKHIRSEPGFKVFIYDLLARLAV